MVLLVFQHVFLYWIHRFGGGMCQCTAGVCASALRSLCMTAGCRSNWCLSVAACDAGPCLCHADACGGRIAQALTVQAVDCRQPCTSSSSVRDLTISSCQAGCLTWLA